MKKYEIPMMLLELEKDNFHILVKVSIANDQPIVLLIDTGASKTVFNASLVHLYHPIDVNSRVDEIQSSGISEGKIETGMATLKKFKIEKFKLKKLEVATIDIDHINELYAQFTDTKIDGLIGSDFLKKYKAVINYKKEKLTLYCKD